MHQNKDDLQSVLANMNYKYSDYFIYVNDDYVCENPLAGSFKCSAITLAILAESVSIAEKRRYVNILLTNGFQLTDMDLLIVKSEIYDNIPIEAKNNIILFSSSDLLTDAKLYIIKILIEQYNPLPC